MINNLTGILKYFALLLIVLVFTYFSVFIFADAYEYFVKDVGTSGLASINLLELYGYPLGYIFYIALVFSLFKDVYSKFITPLLLLPVVLVTFYARQAPTSSFLRVGG